MGETAHAGTTTGHGDGALDPHAAALLLAQTESRARRELDFRSPGLSLLAGAAALIAFGSVWLSVRGQHPYRWPTPAGLAGLYAVLAVRIGSVILAYRRAQGGVSGRSVRRRQAEGAALAAALVAVYVVMVALAHDGASDGVAYGVYVATATLLVLGTFGAASAAARHDWQELGVSIAVMVIATVGAFAGPRGVWLADGVGLCAVMIALSAVQAGRLRASGPAA